MNMQVTWNSKRMHLKSYTRRHMNTVSFKSNVNNTVIQFSFWHVSSLFLTQNIIEEELILVK